MENVLVTVRLVIIAYLLYNRHVSKKVCCFKEDIANNCSHCKFQKRELMPGFKMGLFIYNASTFSIFILHVSFPKEESLSDNQKLKLIFCEIAITSHNTNK